MPESIGQRLKLARQDRRLSIEQAAEATRIRPHYLQALEADDYSVMPSAAQARGFLRNYAEFLSLDLQAILTELQAAQPAEPVSGPLPQVDLALPAPEAAANLPVVEEPSKRPFWRAWLDRARKPDPTPEPTTVELSAAPEVVPVIAVESQPEPLAVDLPAVDEAAPAIAEPPSKPRGRKKKIEAEPPVPAVPEPPTRKRRPTKKVDEVPAAQEPVTRVRRKKKPESEPAESPVEPPAELTPPEPTVAAPQPEAEIPLEVGEQAEVQIVGAGPSLLGRVSGAFKSIFNFRVGNKASKEKPPTPVAEVQPTATLGQVDVLPLRPAPAEPAVAPEEIFAEIGEQLRKRRELLSLTLEEIERHTRVRAVFAKALEEGNFDQLPSTVQTRGMLTTYTTFLDLDTDALLLRYADALQARHRERFPEKPGGERAPTVRSTLPSLRSFMAGDLFFGLGIVVMLVVMAVWGLIQVFNQRAAQVALPTVPSISEALVGTPLPTVAQEVTLIPAVDTPFALAETATPEGITPEVPTQNPSVNVALNIIITERTFMRVLVDGQEVFNGRVVPGTAYPFEGSASVQVLTGNGAALRVTYNGRDMGLLGNFGEVVDYIYTAEGIVTPTPPAPPTATATPKESPTPSPTPSPTRTPTPEPTSTPQG
jgi:cytoskeletal protein RodZ